MYQLLRVLCQPHPSPWKLHVLVGAYMSILDAFLLGCLPLMSEHLTVFVGFFATSHGLWDLSFLTRIEAMPHAVEM